MKFPEMVHVGYLVHDREAYVEKMKALTGIENWVKYDFTPTHVWGYGKELDHCKMRIAQGIPETGTRVEIIEVTDAPGTPHEDFIREKGEGIHHIAYFCENMEEYYEWRAYYENLPGGEIIFEAEIEDATMGKRKAFCATMEGDPAVVEFCKRTKV